MLAVLLVVVAQAAPPKGLGLRELQERARRNDPRTMQVAAQLEAARGKRDEASWVVCGGRGGPGAPHPPRTPAPPAERGPPRLKDAQQTAQKLLAEKSEQISRADSMKLDYLAEEVEAQHASAVKNRDLALIGLRLLVGAQAGEDLPILVQELPQAPQPPNADEILRRALQQRPEARAANEGVAARQALVDLARARLWPDFGIVGGVRLTTTTNADNPASPFVDNPYHESSGFVALGMQWTLDGPQKLARLRQAEGELHEAVAMQVGAEQLVRLDVQQALGDLADARVRVERYGNETQIGKQLSNQAGVAFDSGLGDARELLEGTLLFMRADGERLRALYDAQLAWAALEKAAGAPLGP